MTTVTNLSLTLTPLTLTLNIYMQYYLLPAVFFLDISWGEFSPQGAEFPQQSTKIVTS